MYGVQQVFGPAPQFGGYSSQQVQGPSPMQVVGPSGLFPMQTTGFDMSSMMNMMMMIMMMAIMMSMMKPMMRVVD